MSGQTETSLSTTNIDSLVERFESLYRFLEDYNSDSRASRLFKVFIPVWMFFAIAFLMGLTFSAPVNHDGNLALELASGLEYTTLEILANNLFVGLLLATAGALVVPIIIILLGNGYMIGEAIGILSFEYGPAAFFIITPHGLFEIPAAILAAVAGGRLSMFVFTYYVTVSTPNEYIDSPEARRIYTETKRKTIQDYVLLVMTSFVLFVIAAIIETTITIDFIYYFT